MIIQIIKGRSEEYDEAVSINQSYFIKTISVKSITSQLFHIKYIPFLKNIRSYFYFRLLINNNHCRFSLYSKKDLQKFQLLFSPDQVVVISNNKLSILQDKINTAFHDSVDLFFSLFIYSLSSVFSKFEFYEKTIAEIIFSKKKVTFISRLSYFIDYFIIKSRLNKNHRSLNYILNSPTFNTLSNSQKITFKSLIIKNEFAIKYLPKFQKKYLLYNIFSKQKAITISIAFTFLTIFTFGVVNLSIVYEQNAIPYLIILLTIILLVLTLIHSKK